MTRQVLTIVVGVRHFLAKEELFFSFLQFHSQMKSSDKQLI